MFQRRWFAVLIALVVVLPAEAQEPPAGDQPFINTANELIAAVNADDQAAIQQMFNEGMRQALPPEKTGPFFRDLLAAKGQLQSAGAPDVHGPAANVRVTAERGDWNFEITLDPSGKIAGLRVLPVNDAPRDEAAAPTAQAMPEDATESDGSYLDLRKSEDRLTRQLAERYYNLVKMQEWSSDKGTKITAKYVSHTPNLSSVTLSVARREGGQRTMKEMAVPVTRLSKTCQSRVKQISVLQVKLDELASGAAASADGAAAAGGPEDTGSPMVDERGVDPRPRAGRRAATQSPETPAEPPQPRETATGAASTNVSSTADDGTEDPLGFAELPPVTLPGGGGPSGPVGPQGPAAGGDLQGAGAAAPPMRGESGSD